MAGKRSLLLLAVLSLVISLLGLPLYAKTIAINSPAGHMVDDIKRGARDFGRGVRDMVDPDGDGILPDGSLDNGIAGDGDQFVTDNANGNMTGNVSDNVTGPIPNTPTTDDSLLDEVLPDTPVTEDSRPSPDGNIGDVTDNATGNTSGGTTTHAPTTSGATTTSDANTDNTDGENGGFRWTGLVIALIIAVAVIVLICLLIPKKKNR